MSFYDKYATCPFYAHDNVKECTITCESVLPGSTIKHHFPGKQKLAEAVRKYCGDRYQDCPWYKLVSVKWAEGK